jgi:hypothetical protein
MEDVERGNKGCKLANRKKKKKVMCTKGKAMTDMKDNIKQFNKSKILN